MKKAEAKTYEVQAGVDWVNGRRVPKDRKVLLTDAEAQYDLGLGRIKLATAGGAKPSEQNTK